MGEGYIRCQTVNVIVKILKINNFVLIKEGVTPNKQSDNFHVRAAMTASSRVGSLLRLSVKQSVFTM